MPIRDELVVFRSESSQPKSKFDRDENPSLGPVLTLSMGAVGSRSKSLCTSTSPDFHDSSISSNVTCCSPIGSPSVPKLRERFSSRSKFICEADEMVGGDTASIEAASRGRFDAGKVGDGARISRNKSSIVASSIEPCSSLSVREDACETT